MLDPFAAMSSPIPEFLIEIPGLVNSQKIAGTLEDLLVRTPTIHG